MRRPHHANPRWVPAPSPTSPPLVKRRCTIAPSMMHPAAVQKVALLRNCAATLPTRSATQRLRPPAYKRFRDRSDLLTHAKTVVDFQSTDAFWWSCREGARLCVLIISHPPRARRARAWSMSGLPGHWRGCRPPCIARCVVMLWLSDDGGVTETAGRPAAQAALACKSTAGRALWPTMERPPRNSAGCRVVARLPGEDDVPFIAAYRAPAAQTRPRRRALPPKLLTQRGAKGADGYARRRGRV